MWSLKSWVFFVLLLFGLYFSKFKQLSSQTDVVSILIYFTHDCLRSCVPRLGGGKVNVTVTSLGALGVVVETISAISVSAL